MIIIASFVVLAVLPTEIAVCGLLYQRRERRIARVARAMREGEA